MPLFDSWKETVPAVATASSGFSSPSVVHARTNELPLLDLTVTFSVVGVVAYVLSVHWYVQVASVGCGSQLSTANADGARASASAAGAATKTPLPLTVPGY